MKYGFYLEITPEPEDDSYSTLWLIEADGAYFWSEYKEEWVKWTGSEAGLKSYIEHEDTKYLPGLHDGDVEEFDSTTAA